MSEETIQRQRADDAMWEIKRLEAEVERLRKRTHEIADEQQRRFAPYVSRCERFDTLRKWAREHSGLVDPDGHIPDKAGSAWTYTSEAIRTLVVDALERAETAEAELADARERLRQAEERLAAVETLGEDWDGFVNNRGDELSAAGKHAWKTALDELRVALRKPGGGRP